MSRRLSSILEWWWRWLPLVGIALFLILYLASARLYPGGTKLDPGAAGYSHLSNYWCDLLREASYSGHPNPGRPLAVAATVLLPLSLLPFCLKLAALAKGALSRRLVAAGGSLAMLLATLVFTPLHDLAINLAAPLGLLAFLLALRGLLRAGQRRLVLLAGFALAAATLNWLLWQTATLLTWLPLVQRLAYASFFSWVVATVLWANRPMASRSETRS